MRHVGTIATISFLPGFARNGRRRSANSSIRSRDDDNVPDRAHSCESRRATGIRSRLRALGIVAREVQRYGDDSRKKKYKGVPQSIAYHVRGPNEALRALCALWFVEHVEYADRDIFSAPGSGEAKQRKNNGYTPCLPITAMAK